MHMLSMDIELHPHVSQSSRYSCPVEGGARILGVRIREVLLYMYFLEITSKKGHNNQLVDVLDSGTTERVLMVKLPMPVQILVLDQNYAQHSTPDLHS